MFMLKTTLALALLLFVTAGFANQQVQLSKNQISVIHKLKSVADLDSNQAADAMMSLFRYQKAVSVIAQTTGLTDAARRNKFKAARQSLVADLRPTMSPNEIRKWLDYSLPQLYQDHVLWNTDMNIYANTDRFGAEWQSGPGVP